MINTVRLASVFLFLFPLFLAAEVTPIANEHINEKLDAFGYEVFKPSLAGLNRGNRRVLFSEILDRFGKPLKKTIQLADYRDPDPIKGPFHYEVHTWYYSGLELQMGSAIVLDNQQVSREGWIQSIVISTPEYKLKHNLRIGLKSEQFIEVLGKPTYQDNYRISYDVDNAVEVKPSVYNVSPYQIELRLNKKMEVDKIEWTWWWH
jgi:hypothetical protein